MYKDISILKEKIIQNTIYQLKDLAEDRKSFFNSADDDDIFHQDYNALNTAIALITTYCK